MNEALKISKRVLNRMLKQTGNVFTEVTGKPGQGMTSNMLTVRDYELKALSRMTGEQIANELTDEEREEYYKLLHGED